MIGNFDPKKNKIVVRDFFNILRVCILMCLIRVTLMSEVKIRINNNRK
ncbi:Uncharacterised protein [Shigella flexneri]|nr:Uncharacterised protein [Shigella flexneri 2a]SRL05119.1 Uncharacterised protein [Shigella flexneri]SRM04485.1 Uncharacterised protein [Shigella flexneri]SRO19869.1 Uncharacterised protein [Shigella flexneri]SRO68519.1 Uncharacterised protein [Shigella flexneri]